MEKVLCLVGLVLLGIAVDPLVGQDEGQVTECSDLYTCSDCVTLNTSCAWCNSPELFNLSAESMQSLSPPQLCGTLEELAAMGCAAEDIINPSSFADTMPAGNGTPISVQKIEATIRPGVMAEVNVTVQPPDSVPVDMYVLLDLSVRTEVLEANQGVRSELVQTMRALSSNFRVAYGTFVDKPVSPFVPRANATLCDGCQEPHAFRHVLNFTNETQLFEDLLGAQVLSESESNRRSMLDAILQISACGSEFGWSPPGTSRRIILLLTYSDYHTALDGRIAGLLQVPDDACRVNFDTGFYDAATQKDYPSITQVLNLLNNQQISLIIAVSSDDRSIYDKLKTVWRSAFVLNQSPQSGQLIPDIQKQYQELSTTIVPVVTGLDNVPEIDIDVLPRDGCSGGVFRNDTDDICEKVVFPDSVKYTVTIDVDHGFCQREDHESTFLAQLLFIGYGVVDMEITVNCSCDCGAPEKLSDKCDGKGTFECSTCVCPDGFIGPRCSCNEDAVSFLGCLPTGGSTQCSGNGECICGACVCDVAVEATGDPYTGVYCECDPNTCINGYNTDSGQFLPCSGQGTCGCDRACQCYPGFSGPSCECRNETRTCVPEGSGPEALLCSGTGQCLCGVCYCDDYSIRAGTFCEQCGVCARSCSLLSDCVTCILMGNCVAGECGNIKNVSDVAMIPDYNSIVFRNCSVIILDCEIIYSVDQYVMGNEEEDIYVYIPPSQAGYDEYLNDPNNGCTQSLVIWPIPVGIVLGIILVVIVAIVLWKAVSYLGEYIEYKTWENSQKTASWERSGQNPIFVDPTAKYINPKYRQQSRPINVD